MNGVLRADLLAQLLQHGDAAEGGQGVDQQDLAVERFRQLDLLALARKLRKLDPAGGDGPENLGLAHAPGAGRRRDLLLDRPGQRIERGVALLLLDYERAVLKGDEIDSLARDLGRLGRDHDVPLAGALDAVDAHLVPSRARRRLDQAGFPREPLVQALAPEQSHRDPRYCGSIKPY